MATSSNSSRSGGTSFLTLLAVLFIGLKLGNVIHWSWVWVLAPLWIPWSIILSVFALITLTILVSGGKPKFSRTGRTVTVRRTRR